MSNLKYVYLIQQGDSDLYKIGVSKNINKRKSSLQTANPLNLKIIDSHLTENSFKVESIMHKKWNLYKQKGEWFQLTQENIKEFRLLCEQIDNYLKILKEEENPFV